MLLDSQVGSEFHSLGVLMRRDWTSSPDHNLTRFDNTETRVYAHLKTPNIKSTFPIHLVNPNSRALGGTLSGKD